MLYLINYSKRKAVLFHPFLMLLHVPVHAKSRNAPCRFLTKRSEFCALPRKDGDLCHGSSGETARGSLIAGPRGRREFGTSGLSSGKRSRCSAASLALCPQAVVCASGSRVLDGVSAAWVVGRKGRADSPFRRMEVEQPRAGWQGWRPPACAFS